MRAFIPLIAAVVIAAQPLTAQGGQRVRPRAQAGALDNAQREKLQNIRQRYLRELNANRAAMQRTREKMRVELQRVVPDQRNRAGARGANAPGRRFVQPRGRGGQAVGIGRGRGRGGMPAAIIRGRGRGAQGPLPPRLRGRMAPDSGK